jgi:CHASE3 domain sensor protein
MKINHKKIEGIFLITLTFLVTASCSEPGREQVTEGSYQDSTEYRESRRVLSRVDSAVTDADDEARREREQGSAELKRKVDRNTLDLEELKGKTRKLGTEARQDFEKSIRELEEENEVLKQRLSQAEKNVEQDWQRFRTGFERELDTLGKRVENLFETNKKKNRD